jgi:hypothetical protein
VSNSGNPHDSILRSSEGFEEKILLQRFIEGVSKAVNTTEVNEAQMSMERNATFSLCRYLWFHISNTLRRVLS